MGSSLNSELNSLLGQEEAHWEQRSKATWLREGDRNTRYFHQKASNMLETRKSYERLREKGVQYTCFLEEYSY